MTSSDGFWHRRDLLRCKFIPSESRFETEMGINGCCCIIHCLAERSVSILDFFTEIFPEKLSNIASLGERSPNRLSDCGRNYP